MSRNPFFLLPLLILGCSEPSRPAREADRGTLEAQAQGEGCRFRSSLSISDIRAAFVSSSNPGECRTDRSFFVSLNPGTLGCRAHAIYCLAFLPHPVDSLTPLVGLATSEMPSYDWAGIRRDNVYDAMAYALGKTDDERAVPGLLSLLRSPELVSTSVLDALETLGPKARSAGPRLRELASAERGEKRLRYLDPLLRIDEENSRELLLEWLKDDSATVRSRALRALGTLAPELVARQLPALTTLTELPGTVLQSLPVTEDMKYEALRKMLYKDQGTPAGREAVLDAIGAVGKTTPPPDLCRALVELTRGSNLLIVEKSYDSLGMSCHGDEAALAQAQDDIGAPVPLRRRIAAEFLGRVLERGAVPKERFILSLRRLVRDPSPSVRKTAQETLRKIGVHEAFPDATQHPYQLDADPRDRALYDVAEKALHVSTLRSAFKGTEGIQNTIEGTIISTVRGQHRIDKYERSASGSLHEVSTYIGHEEWSIGTYPGTANQQRTVSRLLTEHPVVPPFTPVLMVRSRNDGTIELGGIARFNGREWLTDYSFLGEDTVNGEVCYHFEHQSTYNRTHVWISKRMGVLCKEETYHSGGGLNVVNDLTPSQSIIYSDYKLNEQITLADLCVQPEVGDTVHEHSYFLKKNRSRDYLWK